MTGPQDPAAAGSDRLRVGHADREQVIEALKDAFVQGRLTRDELGARAGEALAARTYADLAGLTADIPPTPAATGARLARPPASARRRPLARAAAKSGGCLVIVAAAVRVGTIADPGNTPGRLPHFLAPLCLLVAVAAVVAALVIMVLGVAASVEQRRSRRQLPPRPGPDGHALDSGQRGADHGPVPPSNGQAPHAELQAHPRRRQVRVQPGAP